MRRGTAQNMGLPQRITSIKWVGRRGMRWHQLMHQLQDLAMHSPPPRALVLHLGSNDLTSVRCGTLRLFMRRDIRAIHNLFPYAKIVVSAMLQRRTWSWGIGGSYTESAIENKRKTLNRFLRRLSISVGGTFIPHEDITSDTTGLYYSDGVHLSDIGNDLLLMCFRYALETWVARRYFAH